MNPERPHLDKDRLLKRWLTGDATRQDERDMESLSQGDPFLADAMEGYRSMPEGNHAESVTRLKTKLRQKTDDKQRVVVFYLLRVAAIGAVLVAAWVVFNQIEGKVDKAAPVASEMEQTASGAPEVPKLQPQEQVVAREEETSDGNLNFSETGSKSEVPNPMEEIAKKETKGPAGGVSGNTARDQDFVQKNKRESFDRNRVDDEAGGGKLESEEGLVGSESIAGNALAEETERVSEPVNVEMEAFNDEAAPVFKDEARVGNSAPMVHKIVGQVTNDFGDPLTGASVVEEVTQKGTVTDQNGYFAIETEANQPNLRISYLGYEEKNLAYSDEDFLNVKLDENTASLEEVKVAAKKSKASPALPQPKGGFAKLEKYIRKNIRRPENDNDTTGEVKLRFRIQSNGVPTDFEVLESLGDFFDEEAKRLLQSGPKWENPTGDLVTYAIKF